MPDAIPITGRQPVKALFVAVSLAYCFFFRLPFLAVYYLPTSNRPHPQWTWQQSISTSTAKLLFRIGAMARFARVFPIDRSNKNPKKVLIPAVPQTKLHGVLLGELVQPVNLMGTWYPSAFNDGDNKKDTKVVLFMFGGAYVMGDDSPENYSETLKQLCPALNAKFFIFGYRLAGSAGGQPFPSQLQDLLSAYLCLLEMDIPSKNIIVAGESAGGNAVLSLLRYLEDVAPSHPLPFPGAALLSSPWIDLTPQPALRALDRRYMTDFAGIELVEWGRRAVIPTNRNASDVYISPAMKPFQSRVPIWIEAGTEEVTFDDLHAFSKSMKAAGTDTEFFALEDGTHAPMWAAAMLGFDPSLSVASFVEFCRKKTT